MGYARFQIGMLIMCAHLGHYVEAVTLRAPGTSRCPTDKGAAFICGVNGTLLIWTVDDDDGGDRLDYTLIHYHADSVGGVSVTRNGYLATLVNKSEDGQPASLFSVLTIFSSARKNLTIICSNNQDSQAVPFYLEIPAPPPPPEVNYSMSSAMLELNFTIPTNPGQTVSHLEISLNDENVFMVNVNSQRFSAPAMALNTVAVRTVDTCGQKSEPTVINTIVELKDINTKLNVSCLELLNEYVNLTEFVNVNKGFHQEYSPFILFTHVLLILGL